MEGELSSARVLVGRAASNSAGRDAEKERRTSTNSFELTPLESTPPSADDSLVTSGSRLASRACFSVTSSNRAPRSSAGAPAAAPGTEKAGSSRSTTRAKRRSRLRARTRAPSGESSASFVSLRSERSEGVIGSGRLRRDEGGKGADEEEEEGGEGT